ncbi:hypothetical protein Mgra_00002715 [Meloidogyne graminicola]|uniref:Uncharacterized protein n=1 Tax=Meloidogyne graminicola TaxID=189291 RepID=A0A8S9ZWX7_9BILA|nr:hypothetical protein Mgra_00002715 [Meloidogyne graminicola]
MSLIKNSFLLKTIFVLLNFEFFFIIINANPLISVGNKNSNALKIEEKRTNNGWAQHSPFLMPYSNGNADQQFGGGAIKRTSEGHFMEPSGWLALEEPGRFEWNFNRLR